MLYRITKDNPLYGEYVECFETMSKAADEHINSWGELFAYFNQGAKLYLDNKGEITANMAVANLRAFILALEEFPEEGDAKKIFQAAIKILIMRPDMVGIDYFLLIKEVKEEVSTIKTVLEALVESIKNQPEGEEMDQNGAKNTQNEGKTLH